MSNIKQLVIKEQEGLCPICLQNGVEEPSDVDTELCWEHEEQHRIMRLGE